MHTIRFENTADEHKLLVKSFLRSLHLDPKKWLEEQTFEIKPEARINVFENLVLVPSVLIEKQEWVCTIESRGDKKYSVLNIFCISGWLAGSFCGYGEQLRGMVKDLPSQLKFLLWGFPRQRDLHCLSELTSLNSLVLSNSSNLEDLSPLINLGEITGLNLQGCTKLVDLQPLNNLLNLEGLNLSGCELLNDLTHVSHLTKLARLILSGCKSLIDVSPLDNVTSLKKLNLSDCKSVVDLNLKNLKNLTALDLSGCGKISKLILEGLISLKILDVSRCSALKFMELDGLIGLDSLSLHDLKSLRELRMHGLSGLLSLNLSFLPSLADLSGLIGLSSLATLRLSYCPSLDRLDSLIGMTRLNHLDISGCESVVDMSPLGEVVNLQSLSLLGFSKLIDLKFIFGLTNLVNLGLSHCDDIRNLDYLSNHHSLQYLTFTSRRVSSIEPLRAIASLRNVEHFNPPEVAELLAHAAVLRSDRDHIAANANAWLQEAINWQDGSLPFQDRFATTLGEAFSLLGEHEIELPYEEYLQSKADFSSSPWKAWLAGTRQQSGADLMCRRIERQDIVRSTPGCIGGICAVMPDQSGSVENQAWGRDWLQRMAFSWQTRSKELLPVSAEVCLAHARLGLQQALECWLDRFTDSSDPAALDPVQAALGQWQLDQNDTNAALHHAMAIHQPQVRDPLLGRIVERCHSKEADLAGRTLLMITDEALAGRLASSLAQDEIFVATASNVERLIVSCGTSAQALAELIGQISSTAEATPLQALSARLQSSPEAARKLRRSLLLRLIDEI